MKRVISVIGVALLLLGGCLGPDDRDEATEVAPPAKPEAFRPEEQFEEAYIRILEGQFEQAIARLERINARPDRGGTYADDVQFWLGYCKEESGRLKEAWEAYEWLVISRPDSSYTPVASSVQEDMRRQPGR